MGTREASEEVQSHTSQKAKGERESDAEWVLGRPQMKSNPTRPGPGSDKRDAEWVLERLQRKSNLTRPKSEVKKERGMGTREASEEVQSHTSQKRREKGKRNGY